MLTKETREPTTLRVERRREFKKRHELDVSSQQLIGGLSVQVLVSDKTYDVTTPVSIIENKVKVTRTPNSKFEPATLLLGGLLFSGLGSILWATADPEERGTGIVFVTLGLGASWVGGSAFLLEGETLESGPIHEDKGLPTERIVKSKPASGRVVSFLTPFGTTTETTNSEGIARLMLSNAELIYAEPIQVAVDNGLSADIVVPEQARADAIREYRKSISTYIDKGFDVPFALDSPGFTLVHEIQEINDFAQKRILAIAAAKREEEAEVESHNEALRLFYEGESFLAQRKRGKAAERFVQSVKILRKIDDVDSQNLADFVEEQLAALRPTIRASDIDSYDQANRIYSWRPIDNPMENILATAPAGIKGEVVHVDGEVLQNFYNQRFLIWDYRIQRAFLVYTPNASEWVTGQSVGIIGRVRGIETYRTADGTSNTVGVIDVLAWKTCALYAGRCYP